MHSLGYINLYVGMHAGIFKENGLDAPQAWDLRCEVREKLIAFLQREMREALPRERADISPPLSVFGREAPSHHAAMPN